MGSWLLAKEASSLCAGGFAYLWVWGLQGQLCSPVFHSWFCWLEKMSVFGFPEVAACPKGWHWCFSPPPLGAGVIMPPRPWLQEFLHPKFRGIILGAASTTQQIEIARPLFAGREAELQHPAPQHALKWDLFRVWKRWVCTPPTPDLRQNPRCSSRCSTFPLGQEKAH